jgi:hypothetical protein
MDHTILLSDGTVEVRTSTARNPYRYAVLGGIYRLSILQSRLDEARSYEQRADEYTTTAIAIRNRTWQVPDATPLLEFAERAVDRYRTLRGLRGDAAIDALAVEYDRHAEYQRSKAQRLLDAALAYDASGIEWRVISCHGSRSAAERGERSASQSGTGTRRLRFDVVEIREIDDEQ